MCMQQPIGRYNESEVPVPVERHEHCWSSKSMLGPKWPNISSVKMKELEAFQLCDEIQAESSLDRSVHFRNSKYIDSIFGVSWRQQWCNLRSFDGGINIIDPHIGHRSVLVIS